MIGDALAIRVASHERYVVTSETRNKEQRVPYVNREAALMTAADIAEQMRLGRLQIRWIAVDDLQAGARNVRIFFYEKG